MKVSFHRYSDTYASVHGYSAIKSTSTYTFKATVELMHRWCVYFVVTEAMYLRARNSLSFTWQWQAYWWLRHSVQCRGWRLCMQSISLKNSKRWLILMYMYIDHVNSLFNVCSTCVLLVTWTWFFLAIKNLTIM